MKVWGAILDIITIFFNICSTSNLPAKLYIEYSHCYFFLPNSIYICYVLPKRFLCSQTVWSTLRTVWYGAPRAGFSKIGPRPLSASDTASDRGKNGKFSRSVDKYIARQARSLQENFNESNVQPIEQPMLEIGLHGDNLQLLNVGFCLDYYGVKLSLFIALFDFTVFCRYCNDKGQINDRNENGF